MRGRFVAGAVILLLLLACKRDRADKNDDIAACNATGGRWVEGGCNDTGHCEKTTGVAPDDDDELGFEEDDEDSD